VFALRVLFAHFSLANIRKIKSRIEKLKKELKWSAITRINSSAMIPWLAKAQRKSLSPRTLNHYLDSVNALPRIFPEDNSKTSEEDKQPMTQKSVQAERNGGIKCQVFEADFSNLVSNLAKRVSTAGLPLTSLDRTEGQNAENENIATHYPKKTCGTECPYLTLDATKAPKDHKSPRLMEAGGIEPPSRDTLAVVSTCVVCCFDLG